MLVINLFFIPVIAVCIFSKLKGTGLKPDINTAVTYMIACSLVAILTKGTIMVARVILEFEPFSESSAYYSIVALVISLILPFIADKIKFEIKKG